MGMNLNREIDRWLDEGLISAEQAEAIKGRYRDTATSERRARVVKALGIVGATVVGVGVILFFAANWDAIPRGARLALLVGALVASYAGGFYLREVRRAYSGIGHALILLGALLFGAGLFLVGQMYHVQAHDPLGFLVWAAAAFATALIVRSAPVATLAILAFGAWIGHELYLVDGETYSTELYIPVVAALYGAALYAVGTWGRRWIADLELAGPMRVLGFVIGLGGAFVFTFPGFAAELDEGLLDQPRLVWGIVVALALAAVVGAVVLALDRTRRTGVWEALSVLALTALVLLAVVVPEAPGVEGADPILYPVAFNLLVAVLALGALVIGYQNDEPWLVNAGVVFVGIDVVARYFDLFWDMMPRSLVFIGVGALILTLAWALERQRSRLIERMEQ
jgi:uncharacterized membrane protein